MESSTVGKIEWLYSRMNLVVFRRSHTNSTFIMEPSKASLCSSVLIFGEDALCIGIPPRRLIFSLQSGHVGPVAQWSSIGIGWAWLQLGHQGKLPSYLVGGLTTTPCTRVGLRQSGRKDEKRKRVIDEWKWHYVVLSLLLIFISSRQIFEWAACCVSHSYKVTYSTEFQFVFFIRPR